MPLNKFILYKNINPKEKEAYQPDIYNIYINGNIIKRYKQHSV